MVRQKQYKTLRIQTSARVSQCNFSLKNFKKLKFEVKDGLVTFGSFILTLGDLIGARDRKITG